MPAANEAECRKRLIEVCVQAAPHYVGVRKQDRVWKADAYDMGERVILEDEQGRLAALRRLEILDTGPEEPFEHIVSLVRSILGVPIAAVSLVDGDRQWFKARIGLDTPQTSRNVSFCSHAIQSTQPFLVEDALEDVRFAKNPLVTDDPGIRSYAGIPLRTAEGYQVGALCAIDKQPRHFSEDQLTMLGNLARIVEKELELRRIAERDALTGSLTRRAFLERMTIELDRFHRYGRNCTLVVADIDHFKNINDTYGHAGGDCVLRDFVALSSRLMRDGDVLGRIGGEEFAMLLPETAAPEALVAVERIRKALEDQTLTLPSGEQVGITASFGLAAATSRLSSVDTWMSVADELLYVAKRSGRNRCEIAA